MTETEEEALMSSHRLHLLMLICAFVITACHGSSSDTVGLGDAGRPGTDTTEAGHDSDDPWAPTSVPYDPTCARDCLEVGEYSAGHHVVGGLVLRYNPAVDDPIAQWGDCLESMLVCLEGGSEARACMDEAACPTACKRLVEGHAGGATDKSDIVAAFERVFIDEGAPCRPVAPPDGEVTP